MGFLSSLLTVGGAAAGFALGGPAGASLGASLGGAVGGGIDQSGAAKKASKAQLAAQAAAQAAREKAYAEVQRVQAPGVAAYGAGINALTGRLGLPTQGVAGTSAAASGNALTGKPSGGFAGVSPIEGDKDPTMGRFGEPPTDRFGEPSSTVVGEGQTMGAAAPASGPPVAGQDPGTFGHVSDPNFTAPTYSDPGNFTYGLDQYKASPGYQYRQEQARNGILASSTATGALRSGAALKALYDRADQIAYQDFTGERAYAADRSDKDRNFGRGIYQDDRNYGRDTYENDRNYLTDRADTQTNNLFKYTGIGENAAGIVSRAATGNGADTAQGLIDSGDIKAGNALQQGSIWSGVAGDVAGTIASGFRKNALTSDLRSRAAANPYLF